MKNINKTYRIVFLALIVIAANSCMVGPNFQKTEITTPREFRFSETPADTTANLNWRELFKDPVLTELIDSALANNFDARIAASRIMESRYYLGYTKADQLPNFYYNGNAAIGNSHGRFPNWKFCNRFI
jgi:outer membrane protein, multidrug efflux system